MSRRRKRGSNLRVSAVEPPKGWDDWRKLKPTRKQREFLRDLALQARLPVPQVQTRGQAADAIDRLQRKLGIEPKPFVRKPPRRRETKPFQSDIATYGPRPLKAEVQR